MAKAGASRSRRSGSRGQRVGRGRESAAKIPPTRPIRTIGIDPSWFAFRARDGRGLFVQLVSLAGVAVGLFAAVGREGGSTQLAGSEQIAQFAYLASVFGLLAVPLAAAAGTDAGLTWLARRGALRGAALERASAFAPPLIAFLVGCAVPPVLFALGGHWLYLGVAAIVIVVVAIGQGLLYLGRRSTEARSGPDAPG